MARAVLLLPELARVFAGTAPTDVARALGRADRTDGDAGRDAQWRRHFALLPDRRADAALARLAERGADAGELRRHAWLRVDPAHLRAMAAEIEAAILAYRERMHGSGLALD